MPSADKRARKKENARAAREQREAAARRRRRTRSAVTVGVVVAIFVAVIVLLGVTGSKKKATPPAATTTTTAPLPAGCVATVPAKTTKPTYKSAPKMTIDTAKTYVAHVVTTCGSFDVTLDPKVAPKTANNFVFLAKSHFYDGLTFHRLVKDFVIQGGDPAGDGTGGPGYDMPIEPPKNGYKQGSVAMAGGGGTASGSQFFVTVSANGAKGLGGPPYTYSDLGTVTKGFDAVTRLMKLASDTDGPPTHPLYIFKVTISES